DHDRTRKHRAAFLALRSRYRSNRRGDLQLAVQGDDDEQQGRNSGSDPDRQGARDPGALRYPAEMSADRSRNRARAGRRVSIAFAAVSILLCAVAAPVRAQNAEAVSPERAAARQWFQNAKFGMFIHWGVYSLLGQGEWVMQNRSIPVNSYEWLAS